jgi:hypothetical protein
MNPDRIIYKIDDELDFFKSVTDQFELIANQKSTKAHWGSVGLFNKNRLNVSQSPYILGIVAYDGDIGLKETLSSRKIITVYVLNKGSTSAWSDSNTGFSVDSYSAEINEEVPENTFVVKIKANIPDEHVYQNSKSQGMNFFYLNI